MLPREEAHLLQGRVDDLINAAAKRRQHAHTEFLDMSESSYVMSHLEHLGIGYLLDGGYADAERKLAVIESPESQVDFPGYLPVSYISIKPEANRFLKVPNHRDYLGALMNLGIERRVLGDILMQEEGCILICMSHISEYILTRLTHVGNCHVTLDLLVELSETQMERQFELIRNTVASLRLDSVVKTAVNVSRSTGMALIKSGRVFVNGREAAKASMDVVPGMIISVRGHGKFRIKSIGTPTKKDRIPIEIQKYT